MISRRSLAFRVLIGLLFGVSLAFGLPALWHKWNPGRPVRVVLVAEGTPWPGFSPAQTRGLLLLVADALEVGTDLPVVLASDLLGPIPKEASVLSLRGGMVQGATTVEASLTRSGHPEQRWRATGSPRALFHDLLKPFAPQGPWEGPLIPDQSQAFATLLDVTGWESDQELPIQLASAQRLVREVPDCASAWLALAGLEHQHLVLASDSDPLLQEKCQEHFQLALAQLTAHPRATHQYSIYLTDIGNQREALAQLEQAIRAHPRIAQLHSALAYASRSSGLLQVGLQAVAARERLQGASKAGYGLAENVYLYSGDLDRFGKSLGSHAIQGSVPLLDFYRAYLHLLRGDREGALQEFHETATTAGDNVLFQVLAKIYTLALEGKPVEAGRVLDELRDQRLRLRVPDGEFTFKLAEAYGFLGRHEDALFVAERAFSQGFGCTQWYEATPMLAGIRNTPRWRALIQHMKERQALLASRSPPGKFK